MRVGGGGEGGAGTFGLSEVCVFLGGLQGIILKVV